MFAFLISVVLIAICIIPIAAGMQALDSVPLPQQASSEEGNIFYFSIYIAIGLLILAIATAVLLSIFQVIVNPKGAMKGLISFAILVVVFIIFYSMADAVGSGTLADTIDKFNISSTISKIIGAAINLTLLVGLCSIVLMIGLEIWNYFKNA